MLEKKNNLYIFNSEIFKFFKRALVFGSIIVLFIGGNYAINQYNIFKNPYRFDKNISILICGDSHIKTGVSPKIINNSVNVAQNAESTFLSYLKIRALLNKNPQIKTVIVGFAEHNLSSYNDDILKDGNLAKMKFDQLYSIIGLRDLENVPHSKNFYFNSIFRNMCMYPKDRHFDYVGGFAQFEGKGQFIDPSSLKVIERHFGSSNDIYPFSKISFAYLDSIYSITSKQNIDLVLLNTPVHEKYYEGIPKIYKEKYDVLKDSLQAHYDDILILDFSKEKYSNEMFTDFNHLSKYGAVKLSDTLSTIFHNPL